MRRLDDDSTTRRPLAEIDLVRDATVLLIGRGAAYPALSVSLGERMGVVGALSIEAAAKHLNTRDIDGIVLGEGFSTRVMAAFLIVLAEDPRFRNLPVVLTSDGLAPAYDITYFFNPMANFNRTSRALSINGKRTDITKGDIERKPKNLPSAALHLSSNQHGHWHSTGQNMQ